MFSGGETICISPGAEGLIESLGLRCVQDGWREDLPGKVVNDRGDRQVLRIGSTGLGGPHEVVYLKRWRFAESSLYRYIPGKMNLRYRAATEFENLQKLKSIGIRVPEPLFLAEERETWGPVATLLLLEGLVDYVPTSEWIREHVEGTEFLCREIAHLLAVLHRHGYYYRSPGLKHFYVHKQALVTEPSLQGSPESNLALIDVPRLDHGCCQRFRKLLQRLGLDPPCPERDLSKVLITLNQELHASEDDLELFWSTYCSEGGVESKADDLRRRVQELAGIRLGRRQRRMETKP